MQQSIHRREAGWMAMILNSQYADAEITPGQLLGEKPIEVDKKAERKKAEKKLAAKLKKSEARLGAQYNRLQLTDAELVARIGKD
jgi:hypothetical protein